MEDAANPPAHSPAIERDWLLRVSLAVSVTTVTIAFGIAWLTGTELRPLLTPDIASTLAGLQIAGPLIVLFFVLTCVRWRPIRQVYEVVTQILGPALQSCSWWQTAAIAVGAGVSEELLFRGALQGWATRAHLAIGLIVPNLVFGLLHAVTWTYAIFACCIGFYLSCSLVLVPNANLWSVILAHAAYDFIAFEVIARASKSGWADSQASF